MWSLTFAGYNREPHKHSRPSAQILNKGTYLEAGALILLPDMLYQRLRQLVRHGVHVRAALGRRDGVCE